MTTMYTPEEQRRELWWWVRFGFVGGIIFAGGFGWLIARIVRVLH